MNNAEILLSELIEENFPGRKPIVELRILKHNSIASVNHSLFGSHHRISLNKEDYKLMNEFALIGVLIHELCHVKHWMDLSILKRIRYRSQFNSAKDEREADMMVINMGYGEHLLAFHKYNNRYYKAYNKSDGLTKKEVRSLIRGVK